MAGCIFLMAAFALLTTVVGLSAPSQRLATPPTVEAMMAEAGRAAALFSRQTSGRKIGIIEFPLPATGATELDEWPGGIRQKGVVLSSILSPLFRELNFSTPNPTPLVIDEDDCVAIWKNSDNVHICSFATPESIDELRYILDDSSAVLLLLLPQFFLDPLSRESSKQFLASAEQVYMLEQLNMRGERLAGALPVRGLLYRSYPAQFQAGRRLDAGGYVTLASYSEKPSRGDLEKLFLEDSKTRDGQLSMKEMLQKLVPRLD
jgi:hypothetical protein